MKTNIGTVRYIGKFRTFRFWNNPIKGLIFTVNPDLRHAKRSTSCIFQNVKATNLSRDVVMQQKTRHVACLIATIALLHNIIIFSFFCTEFASAATSECKTNTCTKLPAVRIIHAAPNGSLLFQTKDTLRFHCTSIS